MSISKITDKSIRNTLLILTILFCFEVSAQPKEGKTVTIMVGKESPSGCKLLGKVKGSSNDEQTSKANENSASYVDRLMKARNNLINEAQKLGGNTVHIIYSNNTGKYEVPGVDEEIFHIGNVYQCE